MEIERRDTMPIGRTRSTRRGTKRARTARSSSRRRSTGITYASPMGTAVLGPRLRTKLCYSTGDGYVSNSVAAASEETFTFGGNNLFDPDSQAGGQQPVGFDQLSALYDRYKVVNCTLELTGFPSANCIIAFYPSTSSTPLTTIQDATAQFGVKMITASNFTGPVNNMRVAYKINSSKYMGIPASDDDLASSTGSSPARLWYWHVHCYNPSGGALTVGFLARLIYDVEFCRPLSLTVS